MNYEYKNKQENNPSSITIRFGTLKKLKLMRLKAPKRYNDWDEFMQDMIKIMIKISKKFIEVE